MEADDSDRTPDRVAPLIVLLFGFMVGAVVTTVYYERQSGKCHRIAIHADGVTAMAMEFARCMSPRRYDTAG